jgi:hypothetical protein
MWKKQTNERQYTGNILAGNELKKQILICIAAGLLSGLIFGAFLSKSEKPKFERYARLQGIQVNEKPLTGDEQKAAMDNAERQIKREQQLVDEACAKDKNSYRCKHGNLYDPRLKLAPVKPH